MLRRLGFALFLSLCCSRAADLTTYPIATGLRDPMELTVAPNGDLYVIEREGRVLRVTPSTGGLFEIGTLPVTALRQADSESAYAREDGLLGITLDPKFAENQRLYLYYSHPTELLNRLSRFTLKDGKLDLSSELVLLDVPTDREQRVCHHGGSLTFGPDGLLYLSTGDNTNPFESGGYAPIDDRPGRERFNAMRSAGNTNDLRGKILRIRPTEKGYDIPKGNLFPPGTAKTRPEIYVMGLRNPFRISVDPRTRILYWGEVGPDAGGAGPKGPAGHDEVNQARSAGNHGWPFVIANNQPYPIVDFSNGQVGALTDPAKPKNPSRINTGLTDLPPARPALIYYPYSASQTFPTLGSGGRNAMAGPVFYYDSRRFQNLLDKADDHSLITYDWMRSTMWKAKLDDKENLTSLEPILRGLKHPMDLETDAAGNYWLLEYGSQWYFNKDGGIRLIRAAGSPPVAKLEIRPVANAANTFEAVGAANPNEVVWWITTGATEKKLGQGPSISVPDHAGNELRAVFTAKNSLPSIARQPLITRQEAPELTLNLKENPKSLSFGQTVTFSITNKPAPQTKDVAVRVRYVPATGHDAGGPDFSPEIRKQITDRQCFACHQVPQRSVGPGYLEVALRYRNDPQAVDKLVAKLKSGGAGNWGEVPMPPQTVLTGDEPQTLVRAILGLADGIAETRGSLEGSLVLPPAPANAQPGGAWEISAEAPGFQPAKWRVPAK